MNDDGTPGDTRSFPPLIGFALGALVGGAAALLLAPASGAKTRRRLGEAARKLGHDAGQTMDSARHSIEGARAGMTEAVTGLGMDVKAAVAAGRDAFRHDGNLAATDPPGRADETLSSPKPMP